VGGISPIIPSSKGLLVFKVIDKKDPPVIPYEDVKQKIYGVLFTKKSKDLYRELQKETLERNHFKILLPF
jgi:parvulin-like peptidyl-prolyl isomerase